MDEFIIDWSYTQPYVDGNAAAKRTIRVLREQDRAKEALCSSAETSVGGMTEATCGSRGSGYQSSRCSQGSGKKRQLLRPLLRSAQDAGLSSTLQAMLILLPPQDPSLKPRPRQSTHINCVLTNSVQRIHLYVCIRSFCLILPAFTIYHVLFIIMVATTAK